MINLHIEIKNKKAERLNFCDLGVLGTMVRQFTNYLTTTYVMKEKENEIIIFEYIINPSSIIYTMIKL